MCSVFKGLNKKSSFEGLAINFGVDKETADGVFKMSIKSYGEAILPNENYLLVALLHLELLATSKFMFFPNSKNSGAGSHNDSDGCD